MMGFTCNLRAILMKTSYEPPIDTSEQLVNSGKNPFVYGSSWAYDYFKNSENKWHNLVAAKLGFFRGLAEDKALDKKIAREGEDVKLLPFLVVLLEPLVGVVHDHFVVVALALLEDVSAQRLHVEVATSDHHLVNVNHRHKLGLLWLLNCVEYQKQGGHHIQSIKNYRV